MSETISVASPADMHVHLRQDEMSSLVVPHVRQGGMVTGYVMPNTIPPLTSVDQCTDYLDTLESHDDSVELFGTLYLHPSITPQEIIKAAQTRSKRGKRRVMGVKSYPRGVTTNSEGGIERYETYYPVFEEMERQDMILNLHGEVPSSEEHVRGDRDQYMRVESADVSSYALQNITIMTAEAAFLSHLRAIHKHFPRLRIVLEHATTKASVEAVKACGDTVGCTITPHHLDLIIDDWAGKPINYCKPVAKTWEDRKALRDVIQSGHPRFFLGSDSAPHPFSSKMPSPATHETTIKSACCGCAAGIYTSPILLPLCATLLDSFGALDRLQSYTSSNARAFYKLPISKGEEHIVTLKRQESVVSDTFTLEAHQSLKDGSAGKIQIVPFWAGRKLTFTIVD
jgi:dihydroorotase